MRPILVALLVSTSASAAGLPASTLLKKDASWFRSPEGKTAVDHILANQTDRGDWPKNFDTSAKPGAADRSKIKGTFDNGASVGEIRVLARAYASTQDERCRTAALRGLDHVLEAQYPNGGWPQSFPPGAGYPRYVTFNDNTFVNLMMLMKDAGANAGDWSIVGPERAKRCREAFQRGVACILKAQVKVDGRLTVWCAQHDEKTLEPRPARSFELVSLSGAESAKILQMLMTQVEPSPEVSEAIETGVAWFAKAKIEGIRVVNRGGDKIVEPDPNAPPIWARFYEIDTNRPFFCGRDGVKKFALAEIEKERRTGYAWYGEWGASVAKSYAAWKRR